MKKILNKFVKPNTISKNPVINSKLTTKMYSGEDVVALLTEFMMDDRGDEYVPEDDDNFISWLKKQGLYKDWLEYNK